MSQGPRSDERAAASHGQRIAHYRIQSRLGEGGMGVVYRAEDTKLRRTVALKVLHPEVAEKPDRRKRFLREGRLAGVLTHPCIATVYDVGQADDRVFIAMELVEGEILGAKLKAGSMTYAEAIRIAREIARGLTKAHEAGVIHRDLKPDNIMIAPDGIVKILDFGVAKPTDELTEEFTDIKTQHGSLVGTPAYMSPEQASGKTVDARSDIFSVGVLLYEMLAGKRPFSGTTWQEIIISINRDSVEPISQMRSDVPADVDHVLARCLAKSPIERYRRARELAEDLSLLISGSSTIAPGAGPLLTLSPASGPATTAPSAGPSSASEPIRARRRYATFGAVAVGIVAATIVALAIGGVGSTPEPTAPVAPSPARSTAPASSVVSPSVASSASAAPTASAALPPANTSAMAAPGGSSPSPPTPTLLSPTTGPQVQPPPPTPPKPKNPILGF